MADLELSTADYSLFGSIITVGLLLGSVTSGKLADYIGRRATIGLGDVLYVAGWLLIACSQGAWSLDLGRLVLGLAGGLLLYALPVYTSEIAPKNIRGGLVVLGQLMSSCGIGFAYLVGLITSWRILAVISTLPCLIQLVGLFFIPESPRWLVMVGRDKISEAALQSLRGQNLNVTKEAAKMKEYTEAVQSTSDNFTNLFQIKYAYALTVVLGPLVLSALSGLNGIVFYATRIFESAGFSGTVGTAVTAVIQLPPVVLSVFLMDKYGRRSLLLWSVSGMILACLSVAVSFLLKEHGWMKDFSPYLALFGILMFSAAYPVGAGVPSLLMSEILPINVKGAAGSLAMLVGGLGSWVVSYTFNFMMDWSSSGTFFIFTSINVFSVIFTAKLVPETKGLTLEEIQESLIRTL